MIEQEYTFEYIKQRADYIDWEDVAVFAPLDVVDQLNEDFVEELSPFEITIYVRKFYVDKR